MELEAAALRIPAIIAAATVATRIIQDQEETEAVVVAVLAAAHMVLVQVPALAAQVQAVVLEHMELAQALAQVEQELVVAAQAAMVQVPAATQVLALQLDLAALVVTVQVLEAALVADLQVRLAQEAVHMELAAALVQQALGAVQVLDLMAADHRIKAVHRADPAQVVEPVWAKARKAAAHQAVTHLLPNHINIKNHVNIKAVLLLVKVVAA